MAASILPTEPHLMSSVPITHIWLQADFPHPPFLLLMNVTLALSCVDVRCVCVRVRARARSFLCTYGELAAAESRGCVSDGNFFPFFLSCLCLCSTRVASFFFLLLLLLNSGRAFSSGFRAHQGLLWGASGPTFGRGLASVPGELMNYRRPPLFYLVSSPAKRINFRLFP